MLNELSREWVSMKEGREVRVSVNLPDTLQAACLKVDSIFENLKYLENLSDTEKNTSVAPKDHSLGRERLTFLSSQNLKIISEGNRVQDHSVVVV